jgi:hypothetical protein
MVLAEHAARTVAMALEEHLRADGRVKRARVLRIPRDVGDRCQVGFEGALRDRSGVVVGWITVVVTAGKFTDDLWVDLRWTRDILGYWWTYRQYWPSGQAGGGAWPSGLAAALADVRHAADRNVVRQSLNRAYRTVKKRKGDQKASGLQKLLARLG